MFADGRPRIVNIKGIRMDAEFGPSMIYITNLDKPGFIGSFSSTLGEAGINIATFHVGREKPGGNAVALIEIDGELPDDVLAKVRRTAAGAAGEAVAVLNGCRGPRLRGDERISRRMRAIRSPCLGGGHPLFESAPTGRRPGLCVRMLGSPG